MITERDLDEAIKECEGVRNPTSSTCMKLASYYTIRDHLTQDVRDVPRYSYANRYQSSTEFFRAVEDMPIDELLPVLDDLISTLQVVNPKLYNGFMRKLAR